MREIRVGDCIEVLRTVPSHSIDAVVTDPPYELGFMGKEWDRSGVANSVELWKEVLRVLKPGGHLLSFGGTRTYHRMACAIEDAGFEIRDQIQWIYGQGFPKSLDVSKAIDKRAGKYVAGEVPPSSRASGVSATGIASTFRLKTASNPQTDSAKLWHGWGTALKPANEPIVLARKPFAGTVAENVLRYGTGALNIDECRVKGAKGSGVWGTSNKTINKDRKFNASPGMEEYRSEQHPEGRFPANVIHDGSEEVLELFPTPGESGSASRFFYCAKASKSERGEGNAHPTVKPIALMRYLVRLVTPPGGTVLDPFAGSGTTGVACVLEDRGFLLIEREEEYAEIANSRIKHFQKEVS